MIILVQFIFNDHQFLGMLNEIALFLVGQGRGFPLGLLGGLIIMVLIGSIIIWFVGTLLFFLPAAVMAGVVWALTGNPNYTGAAFLLVALISLVKK